MTVKDYGFVLAGCATLVARDNLLSIWIFLHLDIESEYVHTRHF